MKKTEFKNLYIFCNISLLLAAFISGLSFVAQKHGMVYVEHFTLNVLRGFMGTFCLLPVFALFKDNIKYKNSDLIKGGTLTLNEWLECFVMLVGIVVSQLPQKNLKETV